MRKKASVILLSLMCMIMIFVLAAVFINIAIAYETIQRAQGAVEEAARVRAQAIDIPLKEQEGAIEVLHPVYANTELSRDFNHNAVTTKEGHIKPLKPSDTNYKNAVTNADKIAKKAAIDQLSATLNKNVDGDKIINSLLEENFCFDIAPLPTGDSGTIDFSCTTKVAGTSITSSSSESLPGIASTKTKYGSFQVQNVVYAGFSFKYNMFISDALENIGISASPTVTVDAIAFPQVDLCTRAADAGC